LAIIWEGIAGHFQVANLLRRLKLCFKGKESQYPADQQKKRLLIELIKGHNPFLYPKTLKVTKRIKAYDMLGGELIE
jgi:hypothetical protein